MLDCECSCTSHSELNSFLMLFVRSLTTANLENHGAHMTSAQTVSNRWNLPLAVVVVMCGCQSQSEDPPVAGADGFVQNMSGRFSASITSDREVKVHYEAPDGVGVSNVDIRAVPVWHLQRVLDGMQSPTRGVDIRWDSLGPGESRVIDLGEPPQLNDGVISIHIEGTAELLGDPIRFSVDQSR